jgi:xanthine/CO dehydrogenase XdhC/CoxF family maturation factor
MESIDLLVLRTARDWLAAGERVLLATVARTWGSSPRPTGSMIALRNDGRVAGYGSTDLQGYGSTRNTSRMEFKERLKATRRHAGLNQTELAERAGLTQTISSTATCTRSTTTVSSA